MIDEFIARKKHCYAIREGCGDVAIKAGDSIAFTGRRARNGHAIAFAIRAIWFNDERNSGVIFFGKDVISNLCSRGNFFGGVIEDLERDSAKIFCLGIAVCAT